MSRFSLADSRIAGLATSAMSSLRQAIAATSEASFGLWVVTGSDDGRIGTAGWEPSGIPEGVAADVGGIAVWTAGGAELPATDGRPARLDGGRLLLRGGSSLAGAVHARRAGPARHGPGVLRGAAHGADPAGRD